MGIYEELGVKRVINCVSTTTPLGSSVTYPEVMDAMNEASKHFVCMNELEAKAGKIIAEITGAQAALVTAGCHAALVMTTAACMMRGTALENYRPALDRPSPEREHKSEWFTLIQRLPDDTEGLRDEVVEQRCHFNPYCNAHRLAGAKIVWVGSETGCTPEKIEEQINEKTAAIAFVGMLAKCGVSLEEVIRIGRRNSVPIIMDASYTIPPRANLREWVSLGVDLVCYSGGKSIRGPTDTGFLVGRRDLVDLAAVQMSPHHGVGRGMKIDKTQIVGLVKALQIYVKQDDETEFKKRDVKCKYLMRELRRLPNVLSVERTVAKDGLLRGWPLCLIILNEKTLGMSARDVVDQLYTGNPGIWTYYDADFCPGGITMNTQNLLDGDEESVVKRFREILTVKAE